VKKLKIKFTVLNDDGKEFSGELDLKPTKSSNNKPKISIENSYSGLKGGIEFLIDNTFLSNLKSAKEVQEELKKENYFHSKESVDKRLRFLVTKKILTRIKEDKIWKYAVRR